MLSFGFFPLKLFHCQVRKQAFVTGFGLKKSEWEVCEVSDGSSVSIINYAFKIQLTHDSCWGFESVGFELMLYIYLARSVKGVKNTHNCLRITLPIVIAPFFLLLFF